MENKNRMGKMLGDDEMENAAGGAGTRPSPKYCRDMLVAVNYPGRPRASAGRVADIEWDESLGEWTYQVEKGYYTADRVTFISFESTEKYYPESWIEALPSDYNINSLW